MKHILVIKHGAFGDLIHGTGAFKALREYYKHDTITLLTDPKFSYFTKNMPYFDHIFFDCRKRSLKNFFRIRQFFVNHTFDVVYDFQLTQRTNGYYKLFWPFKAPPWSGSAKGCHYYRRPQFETIHVLDRLYDQLQETGVLKKNSPALVPDLSWLQAQPLETINPYVILIPGCSKAHPHKRWPLNYFKNLALKLIEYNLDVVAIGGPDEMSLLETLKTCHQRINTRILLSLESMVSLGQGAQFAVGNDTGPSHFIAATGCPVFYCWSGASSPQVFAPRGDHITIFQEKNLEDLTLDRVWKTIYHDVIKP